MDSKADDPRYLSYEEFGRAFFEIAVSEDRVKAAVASIAGEPFEVGPMAQGPGKIAKVTAKVQIQEPIVTRNDGDIITFDIQVPLSIDLLIDLKLDKSRFKVAGNINLKATARAAAPLQLIIDVAPPGPSDITVDVASTTIRGELLRILAGVDQLISRFIAKYVANEVDNPRAMAARTIDVAHRLDSAWTGV
ncbi:hypothetical protein FZI91_15090 [Mycobacterium sp. CBMA271]|uniref:hypothetical protein n=1 Tax=unclassified Mycobacteroides TaxID=2618759 RepID=UPI0012DBF48D|nr:MULTISPECIES: hypothetical protein [unclassified Mycobacteroides]MUM17703.1 hypothetical protein [Mycobacteroides sp. CBMA 326]MUM23022.1 hypothetical protein [Mycobacteroides sp. CBMA 271]